MKYVILFIFLLSLQAYCSDWRYFGVDQDDIINFYDRTSIDTLPNKNLKVWVKSSISSIPLSNSDYSLDDSNIVIRSCYRFLHYTPAIAQVYKMDYEDILQIIKLEEEEKIRTNTRVKALLEFNIKDKMYRSLTYISYKNGYSSNVVEKWDYIVPETILETLYKILTMKKNMYRRNNNE